MQITRNRYPCASLVLLTFVLVVFCCYAKANDILVGKFVSLATKFPPFDTNTLEMYIILDNDKYIVTEYVNGEFKYDYIARQCNSSKHLSSLLFSNGVVNAICTDESKVVKFAYSQNGIDENDSRLKIMHDKNGESLFEDSFFKEQYWVPPFLALRKVNSFKYAPNDPAQLLNHESPEFKKLCMDAGVRLFEKPSAPVRSIAYDFDPRSISGWSGVSRVEVDEDGRTLSFGGFSKHNSTEARKKLSLEFTERRAGDGAGAATINPNAPYYHFPPRSSSQPYYGVDELSADILAFLDVDKPSEYRKAPVKQNAIRYQITLTDLRSGAVLGVQTYVVDRINHRACGVNVDSVISPKAFIFDAITQ